MHCSRGVGILGRKLVVLQTLLLGLQTFESLRDQRFAAWVAFLASEKSSYATGASFVVDVGLTLMAAELSS